MQPDGYCILAHFGAQPELIRLQSVVAALLPPDTVLTVPDSFHITLAYGTGAGNPETVVNYLADWSDEAFAVVVDGVDVFDTEDGYAVHLTARNHGRLTDAQSMSYFFMEMGGFTLSPYSVPTVYHPHITVAYSASPITPFKFKPVSLIPESIDFTRPDETVAATLMLKQRQPMVTQKAGRVIARRNVARLRAIRDALQQIIDDARLEMDDAPAAGSKAYVIKRAADGRRLIGLASSNPYRDRDSEIVAEKALRDAIDAEWQGEQYVGKNVVLFWHDGEPIADVIWADVESGFLIEIAKERDTPYARAIFDMIERLDIDWGVSLGFKARRIDKLLSVFRIIHRKESSILPLQWAANPYTYAEVKSMNTIRSLFLKRNAPEAAELENKLRKGAQATAQKLDEQGVEKKNRKPTPKPEAVKKGKTPPPIDDEDAEDAGDTVELDADLESKALDVEGLISDLISMITDLLGDQTPEDLSDRLMALFAANMDDATAEDDAGDTAEDAVDPVDAAVMDKEVQRKQTELLDQLLEELSNLGELETRLKTLDTLSKLPTEIAKMNRRLGQVEKRLSGGPRAASTDEGTEVDEDDELNDLHKEKEADVQLGKMLPGLYGKSRS